MNHFRKAWGIAFLCGAFSLTAVRIVIGQDPPQIHPQDPHRFMMDGKTWHPQGAYIGLGAPSAYASFYDKLSASGINYTRFWFNPGQAMGTDPVTYQRTGPGLAADGRPRYDLTQFDQSTFDSIRQIVAYAGTQGIIVQLCILDGWHASSLEFNPNPPDITRSWGLKYDYYVQGNNINNLNVTSESDLYNSSHPVYAYQKALVEKIVDTMGDLPNIVFEIANEAGLFLTPPGRVGWQIQLANHLTAYEQSKGLKTHLVMPRDLPNHENTPGYLLDADLNLMHLDMQGGFSRNVPLIGDNDSGYEIFTPDYRRGLAWAILTAGGHCNFIHPWFVSIDDPTIALGVPYMGYTTKFLKDLNIDLAGMGPWDNLADSGNSNIPAWACGRGDSAQLEEAVIYTRTGAVTVSQLPPNYTTRWFNPRDGTNQAAVGGPFFAAPDGNDWVLHIRSVAVLPTVTIAPTDADAAEPNDPGMFKVSRSGDTSAPLTVNFTISGTATSDDDYAPLGTSLTIPAGASLARILVSPIDDTAVENPETVEVTLAGGTYDIGSPSSGTVTIVDDDAGTLVSIPASDGAASPHRTAPSRSR
jgi:hypothetical protein